MTAPSRRGQWGGGDVEADGEQRLGCATAEDCLVQGADLHAELLGDQPSARKAKTVTRRALIGGRCRR